MEENTLTVKAYKHRECGRKKIANNLERIPIYHDISEEETICGCGTKLVKVWEKYTEKINIIPERIIVEKHIYSVYACRVCEGSDDEDHPVFRQALTAKKHYPAWNCNTRTSKLCIHKQILQSYALLKAIKRL